MIKKREDFSEAERYIPLIRYAGYEQVIKEGMGLSNKLPKLKIYHGFFPCPASWDGTKLERTKEVGFSKDPEPVAEFRKYLRACNDKGIRVLFVYAPFFSGAQEKMSDSTFREMKNTFEDLGKEYDIPILSWWDSPISDDTNYFYNATHLNAYGAELFTFELARCLDSLGIVN